MENNEFSRNYIHAVAIHNEDRRMREQYENVCSAIENAALQGEYKVVVNAREVTWELSSWLQKKGFCVFSRPLTRSNFLALIEYQQLNEADEVRISWY